MTAGPLPTLEDLLRHSALPLSGLQLTDYMAWQVYSRLTGYGTPPAEAQAVVDTLARRQVPDGYTTPEEGRARALRYGTHRDG